MASSYTTNYQLNQWEGTDKVLRTEFNADNAKIDAALKANADAIAAEAAAREAGDGALENALAGKGNCKMYVTSYTGTGRTTSPLTLQFPWVPKVVLIMGTDGHTIIGVNGVNTVTVNFTAGASFWVTWSGTTLSWSPENYGSGRMNGENALYHVIAWAAA